MKTISKVVLVMWLWWKFKKKDLKGSKKMAHCDDRDGFSLSVQSYFSHQSMTRQSDKCRFSPQGIICAERGGSAEIPSSFQAGELPEWPEGVWKPQGFMPFSAGPENTFPSTLNTLTVTVEHAGPRMCLHEGLACTELLLITVTCC